MTDTAESTEETPPQEKPAKNPWWERRYTFTGTAVGLVFIWLSLTPSLLPRGPLFQGIVSGAAGAIGYGIGVFAVWLVRYDPNVEQIPVKRGENNGKTLPIKNAVRQLVRLGQWSGGDKSFPVPAEPRGMTGLRSAVLLQAGPGGPILAAAKG